MLRRIPLTGPLVVSLVLIVVATIAVVSHLPALLRAAVAPGPTRTDPAVVVASLLRDHDEDFQRYQDRFNGRSLFYKPQVRRRPPPPRTAPPPRPQRTEPIEPPPPSVPDTYTGPSVIFMLGEEVWFKQLRVDEPPIRLRVGQEQQGVNLISVTPPWTVRVGYAGGEYDVTVFERGLEPFFTPAGGTPSTTPGLIDEPQEHVEAPGAGDQPVVAGDQAPEAGDPDLEDDGTAEQPTETAPGPADGDDEPAPAEGGAGEETEEADDGGPAPEPPGEEPAEQDQEDGVEESGVEPSQDDDDDAGDDDPRPAADLP